MAAKTESTHYWPKVGRQLLREFWVPALLATLWTAYGHYSLSHPENVSALVSRFAAAFFLISWMTGQINRVAKQTRTEASFSGIEQRLSSLVDDLAKEAAEIRAVSTGGDSYCYLALNFGRGPVAEVTCIHRGSYPLYGVQAQLVELECFKRLGSTFTREVLEDIYQSIDIGDTTPGYVKPLEAVTFEPGGKRDLNIFFTARNGGWVQCYRARRVDQSWVRATWVHRYLDDGSKGPHIYAEADDNFPVGDLPTDWQGPVGVLG